MGRLITKATPATGSSVLMSVAGMICPSCAKTVYERAIWNSDADRP